MSPQTVSLADPESGTLDDVVDLDRYPIHRASHAGRDQMVAEVREALADDGVAQLPGFLRPTAVAELQRSFGDLGNLVAITEDRRTPYGRNDAHDSSGETRFGSSDWIAGHITRDMIPPHSTAHRVYVGPCFKRFIADCLSRSQIFEYADPLAGLVATVLPPGGQYGWHYDTNEFVVTIAVSQADSGGAFEYVPALRSPGHENLDGLNAVMRGDRSAVRTCTSNPGDLQLFLGRYSLHRVTEVTGATPRLTLVLSYAERPGVIGPVERTRKVYGRVTEAHLVAASAAVGHDGLIF